MRTALSLFLVVAACNGGKEHIPPTTAGDADTDSDADADTDTDSDTDADTDTEPTDPFVFRTDDPASYARVDRVGMPAVATVLIVSKDTYNAADPVDDVAKVFEAEFLTNLTALHKALDDDLAGIGYKACAVNTCLAQVEPLVLPDAIHVDTTASAGFPNGRLLVDPVVDLTLAVIFLDLSVEPLTAFSTLPVNPPANDLPFLNAFPYLAAAH